MHDLEKKNYCRLIGEQRVVMVNWIIEVSVIAAVHSALLT
jgi:hypothetical protein